MTRRAPNRHFTRRAYIAKGMGVGIMYTPELTHVVQQHGLYLHMYADDIQIYGFCQPSKKNKLTVGNVSRSSQLLVPIQSLPNQLFKGRLNLVRFKQTPNINRP